MLTVKVFKSADFSPTNPSAGSFHSLVGKTAVDDLQYDWSAWTATPGEEDYGKLIVYKRFFGAFGPYLPVQELEFSKSGVSPVAYTSKSTNLSTGIREVVVITDPVGTLGNETKTVTEEEWYLAGSGYELTSRVTTTWRNSTFGYKAVERVVDPGGANLVTTMKYDADEGSQVTRQSNPDGSWMIRSSRVYDNLVSAYDFYHSYDNAGTPVEIGDTNFPQYGDDVYQVTYRPWLDSTMPSGLPTLATCVATVELECIDPNTIDGLSYRSETWIAGVLSQRTDTWSTHETESLVQYRVNHTRIHHSSGSSNVREVWVHQSGADKGRTYKIVDYDGTMRRFSYEKGAYVPGSDVAGAGDYLQTNEWDAGAILTSNPEQATRTATIEDSRGRTVERRLQAYTGSAYETMSTDTWVYDDDVNGVNLGTEHFNEGKLVDRSVRSGSVVEQQSIGGPFVTTVTDSLGRVISVTEQDLSPPDEPEEEGEEVERPTKVTSYTYAGLTETEVTIAGGISRTSRTVRDVAGRTVLTTDEQGITRTHAYSNQGRTTTTTGPGGVTVIENRFIDGQHKSTTGTGVVSSYSDYAVNVSDGYVSTTRYTGIDSGSRYVRTVTDWSGRMSAIHRPSPVGSGEVTESHSYDTAGRLIKIASTSGQASQRFTYDSAGSRVLSGLDLNADDALTLASTDRITQTLNAYQKISGIWWRVVTTKQFTTNGNGTAVYTTVQRSAMKPVANGGALRWTSVTIHPGELSHTRHRDETFGTSLVAGTTVETTDSSATRTSTDGRTTTSAGKLISSSEYGTANPTTYSYDAFGQLLRVVNPLGGVTRTSYDAYGRVDQTIDHAGHATTYSYYPANHANAGMVQSVTNGAGETTTYAYNPRGQVLEVGGSGTYPVKYTYDSYGNLATHSTSRNGGTTWDTTTWTPWSNTGLLKEKTDAAGKKVQYTYHAHGKVNVRTWATGVTTTYSYNSALDLTGIAYSDSTPNVAFAPDRLGRPVSITDGTGTMTRSYHASLPVESNDSYDSNSWLPDRVLHYSWDAAKARRYQMLVSFNGSIDNQTTYGYDVAVGRMTSVGPYTVGSSHTYQYAPGTGLVTGITRTGAVETRRLDPEGRLYGIETSVLGQLVTRHGYIYDAAGRRTRATREDGAYWDYGYNPRGEVTSGKKRQADGAILAGHQFEYTYDSIGNRTAAKAGGDTGGANLRTFGYTPNHLNQYTAITTPGTFDVMGRAPAASTVTVNSQATTRQGERFHKQLSATNTSAPVWQSVSVSDGTVTVTGNRYVPKASVSPVYDDNGNLTSDGRWDYTWDAENRLSTMITTTAAQSAGVPYRKLVFGYDWMGRRLRKLIYNISSPGADPSEDQRFLYDGWNLFTEYSVGGSGLALKRSYTWGLDLSGSEHGAGGVGGLRAVRVKNGSTFTTYAPCYDGNGNIVAWVNHVTGAVESRQEYDPFGNRILQEGTEFPIGFSTKYEDRETGLLYYGYRYYDPVTGRWPSRDPIWEEGGVNLYGFVGNDGVNRWDLLGLDFPNIFLLPDNYTPPPSTPPTSMDLYSASGSSLVEAVKKVLPSSAGTFTPLSGTLLWVPYPGGKWDVTFSVSGTIECCKHPSGRDGIQLKGEATVATSVGVGYGAGGNRQLKRDARIKNTKLRGPKGRIAKNPEEGLGTPTVEANLAHQIPVCENKFTGKITFEVGGRVGAGLTFNPFGNATFSPSTPISFDYGARAGFSTYVGAELYFEASGSGKGTIIIK